MFNEGRRCFSTNILFSSKEFQLDIPKFFVNKEERELASALLKRNINIRMPDSRKREADIVLDDYGIQIEITKVSPRPFPQTHKNSPHCEGLHINGRICEGFLRVAKKVVPYYIVVFKDKWMKVRWVNELKKLVKPEVILITTNFKKEWEDNVADKMISKLTELGVIK